MLSKQLSTKMYINIGMYVRMQRHQGNLEVSETAIYAYDYGSLILGQISGIGPEELRCIPFEQMVGHPDLNAGFFLPSRLRRL